MSALRKPNLYWTKEEYWAFGERSVTKHEYFADEVYVRALCSPVHNDITGNILCCIGNQLRGKPCRVRGSDQRLEVEATGLETYPDVVVLCPPFRYNPQQAMNALDAMVIVEVLSRSTSDYDRNQKFENYQNFASFRHYLLAEQDRIEVEHRFLDDSGNWQSETFSNENDVVRFHTINCELKRSDGSTRNAQDV